MTRPPATMPPRLCPHLRQKTESAAYTEPHLTHVDSTLQCYNAAIQSNWTQNQTNPSATSCWCWTVSKVLKASSSFGFFFGRVKKWICTYTRLKNAHDDNSMHHTSSFYILLTCSCDVQSHEYHFARAFPHAGFHASLPGLPIPHRAGPDCKHAKLW